MRRRLLAALAGGALALAACGGPPSADTQDASPGPKRVIVTPAAPDASPTDRPAAAGPDDPHEQLAFEAPLLDGGTFDGAVSGDVVLWFWAPW